MFTYKSTSPTYSGTSPSYLQLLMHAAEGAAVALRVNVVKQNRCMHMEPKPMLARRVRVYSVVRCTRQLKIKLLKILC